MIQTKPVPRLSDGVTKWATPLIVNTNFTGQLGFVIRAMTAPMLITNFDMGIHGLNASTPTLFNVYTIPAGAFDNISGATVTGQASTIAANPYNNYQDASIKGIALGSLSGNTGTQIFNGIIDLYQPAWGQYTVAPKGQSGFGKFRGSFSRLIRPGQHILILSASPITVTSSQTLTAYLEWIEGDYDYEPMMKGGRL